MKKGIQAQFTWMFILIAGAVILTFFVTVGYKQKALSEQQLGIELESHLDSIISAALQSPGTSLPVPTPAPGIAFSCTRTCDCNLAVGSNPKGTDFAEKIYFTPSYIEGEDMLLWTLPWNAPFRATNFLYITNPGIQYYFVTASSTESLALKEEIKKIMPSNASFSFIDITTVPTIKNRGHAETRFVFLRSGKGVLDDSLRDSSMRGVEVSGNSVQFLFKDEDLLSYELIGAPYPVLSDDLPVLLAAAFSGNENMFRCGMEHAYTKLSIVADILTERAKKLDGHEQRCFYAGSAGQGNLEEIAELARTLQSNPTDAQSVSKLESEAVTIEQLNEDKFRDDCPTLY